MRMIELLYWKYQTIQSILDDIKNQGFDAIKIGPIQNFNEQEGFDWKVYNVPKDFKIGNKLGDKNSLNELVLKANQLNIKIIVDLNCDFLFNKNDYQNGKINFSNLYLQKTILDFLFELKDCNMNGLSINLSKEKLVVFRKLKELLKESEIELYERNTSYINAIFNYSVDDKKIAFIEDSNSYLLDKKTNAFDTSKINGYYELLTYNFSNTLFYSRPIYYPYNESGKRKNDFGISFNKINELDYFDDAFLVSKDIKEANFVKVKK